MIFPLKFLRFLRFLPFFGVFALFLGIQACAPISAQDDGPYFIQVPIDLPAVVINTQTGQYIDESQDVASLPEYQIAEDESVNTENTENTVNPANLNDSLVTSENNSGSLQYSPVPENFFEVEIPDVRVLSLTGENDPEVVVAKRPVTDDFLNRLLPEPLTDEEQREKDFLEPHTGQTLLAQQHAIRTGLNQGKREINLRNEIRGGNQCSDRDWQETYFWEVQEGETVIGVLSKWADLVCWKFVIRTALDWQFEASVVFKGDFLSVSSELMEIMGKVRPSAPKALVYGENLVMVLIDDREHTIEGAAN